MALPTISTITARPSGLTGVQLVLQPDMDQSPSPKPQHIRLEVDPDRREVQLRLAHDLDLSAFDKCSTPSPDTPHQLNSTPNDDSDGAPPSKSKWKGKGKAVDRPSTPYTPIATPPRREGSSSMTLYEELLHEAEAGKLDLLEMRRISKGGAKDEKDDQPWHPLEQWTSWSSL